MQQKNWSVFVETAANDDWKFHRTRLAIRPIGTKWVIKWADPGTKRPINKRVYVQKLCHRRHVSSFTQWVEPSVRHDGPLQWIVICVR